MVRQLLKTANIPPWLKRQTTAPSVTPTTQAARSLNKVLGVFDHPQSAEFVGAAASPESIPTFQGLPEVIVVGRANVGKSTLLNHVIGRRDLVHTSKTPGRTRMLNFFKVGVPYTEQLVLVDAPGYGSRGRPEWGDLFERYIETREELRRIYILFTVSHTFTEADRQMLAHLHAQLLRTAGARWTLQPVLTQADLADIRDIKKIIQKRKKAINESAPASLPPLITSSAVFDKSSFTPRDQANRGLDYGFGGKGDKPPTRLGIENVRRNILDACFGVQLPTLTNADKSAEQKRTDAATRGQNTSGDKTSRSDKDS